MSGPAYHDFSAIPDDMLRRTDVEFVQHRKAGGGFRYTLPAGMAPSEILPSGGKNLKRDTGTNFSKEFAKFAERVAEVKRRASKPEI